MLPRKVASLLRALVLLLCKLLLVDIVAGSINPWITYLLLGVREPTHESYYEGKYKSGIQVILCGLPRSGTMTLWRAMDILGFPCFHFLHLVKPTTCKMFMKAMSSGSYHDWDQVLHNYRAIVDAPAAGSYKQLLEVYPNAKIILNVRNPEKWYRSFADTILRLSNALEMKILKPNVLRCLEKLVLQPILKGTPEDKELSIRNYKLHVEEVKKHVPPHKLHIFDLEKREGWDQLCRFLEVPIPNVPFPFLNNQQSFQKKIFNIRIISSRIVIFSYLALLFYATSYGILSMYKDT